MLNLNDEKETCTKCYKTGIIEEDRIIIYKVCDKCNGKGTVTFIENVFGSKKHEMSLTDSLFSKNIHNLVSKIKELYRKNGMEVDVTIELINNEYHNHKQYIGRF